MAYDAEVAEKGKRTADVDKWLSEAREQYELDASRDRQDRDKSRKDYNFAYCSDESNGQWREEALKARVAAGEPIVQWNRIPTYIQHVQNTLRQNRPGVKISAGDEGVDETAEYLESRIRQTEYECEAESAYEMCSDHAVSCGRGSLRVTTEFIPGTFRQRPIIKRIPDQFSVIWGPHNEYDCSDATRCWVVSQITKDEHRRRFGKKSLLNRTDFATNDPALLAWVNVGKTTDMIQIAEKFEKKCEKQLLWKLKNGKGIPAPKTDEEIAEVMAAADLLEIDDDGKPVTREDDVYTVTRYVINGAEILEQGEAVTDDIGIVPQWGTEAILDGVQVHYGLTHNAKSPQRIINLNVSNIVQAIATAPKIRWKAAVGSIPANLMGGWSSNSPQAVAYYKRFDEQERDLGMPIQENSEAPIQALSQSLQQAVEGLKSSMGIYDASMGQRSNETSGVALDKRKSEGELTNFHFAVNEAKTRKRVVQILIKMIARLDEPGRSYPVRTPQGKTMMVPVGVPYTDPKSQNEITHDLTECDYGVHIEMGPSGTSAKELDAERESQLITAQPELMWVLGPDWIRKSGRPGADEEADILERYINIKTPGLFQDRNKESEKIPQAAQQQIQQLSQKLQTTEAFAQSLHEQQQAKLPEMQQKMQAAQMEDATKRYSVDEQEKTKRTLGLAAIDSKEGLAKFENELQIVHSKLDRSHELMMKLLDQKHQADQASQAQAVQASEADKARQAAAEQQETPGVGA